MPAKSHFGARDFGLRIFDVFLEGRLIPDDARILVGIGILVIRDATGLRPSRPFWAGPILFCAPGPMLWQITHFLNEISPLATSCAIPAFVDVAISATATISVFVIMRPFPFGAGPALGNVGHAPLGRKLSVIARRWPELRTRNCLTRQRLIWQERLITRPTKRCRYERSEPHG